MGSSARSFKYFKADGAEVKKSADLEFLKSLVIPPAWKFVRINPSKGGKIQAVGMDASGRVQYQYNPLFAEKQKRKNFAKIKDFGKLLPKLRKITNEHISLDGLPREKVLAVVMRLINSLYFRVGTDQSAKRYKTFGITTLQKKHLTIGRKGKLSFDFIGKSHVHHRKVIVDEDLAAIVKHIYTMKRGRKLFRYLDEDGKPKAITPGQINAYIKAGTSREYSSKDFRTWGATVLAAASLAEIGTGETTTEIKENIVNVVKDVAEQLGNTPAVCRSSYIHPVVLNAYSSGITINDFRPRKKRRIRRTAAELDPEEKALIKLFDAER